MFTPIYTVYKTINKVNNKIYIGVHKTQNPCDLYIGSGEALKSAIKKYGKSNFTKEILYEFDNANDAYSKEKEIVNKAFINENTNYNLVLGGNVGFPNRIFSIKSREKMSKSHIGLLHSNETKEKMSKSSKSYIFTEQHKNKISKSKKGHVVTRSTKDKLRKFNLGKKLSIKTKEKMSKSRSGVKHHSFSGYYITPWGKFTTTKEAEIKDVSYSSILKWCKKTNKCKITQRHISLSTYLTNNHLDKTFQEIGFDFISLN